MFERGGVNFSRVRGERLPASGERGATRARRARLRGDGRVARAAPAQSLRADGAHERALPRRDQARQRSGVVVRRRHGPHAVLRLRGGCAAFPSHLPRRARAVRRGPLPPLQALVRRVLLPQAPRRAARHRRHFLRRRERRAGSNRSFALARSVADHFLPAYLPIVERRQALAYGERERDFQAYRRGRYVEFNLVYDRGTLFGLQSRRARRIHPHVAAAAGEVALRLETRALEPGGDGSTAISCDPGIGPRKTEPRNIPQEKSTE